MLVCFGNWGAGSLEAVLLNLSISSQVSQAEGPKESPETGEGSFKYTQFLFMDPRQVSPSLQCWWYHPGLPLFKCFRGKPHTRLLILHEVTLNKDIYSPGFSVTSKSTALWDWAASARWVKRKLSEEDLTLWIQSHAQLNDTVGSLKNGTKIWSVQNAHEDVLQAWQIKSISVGESAIVCWTRGFHQHNTHSVEIYTLLCRLSRCRVTNYINHPQEICEDVFVMMQLLATKARVQSLSIQKCFIPDTISCSPSVLWRNLSWTISPTKAQQKPCPISSTSCTRSYTHL